MPATFTYADCSYPLRGQVADAHDAVWRYIAEPNCWWSGAQSVALVEAVRDARNCPLCAERKAALSPYAVWGRHGGISAEAAGVPEAAIEAVHRFATDSSRITRRWLEELIGDDALMLGISNSNAGPAVNLHAAVGVEPQDTGVEEGTLLVRFAEAVVAGALDLADVRQNLAEALGPAAVADAAAVIGTFERMNRIADGTGIAVDEAIVEPSATLRADLGLEAYPSARLPPGKRS